MKVEIGYEGKKITREEMENMAADIGKAAEVNVSVNYKSTKKGSRKRLDMDPVHIRRWNREQ